MPISVISTNTQRNVDRKCHFTFRFLQNPHGVPDNTGRQAGNVTMLRSRTTWVQQS